MRLADYIFLAWRRSRRRLLESILIILAIGLGIGIISATTGFYAGIRSPVYTPRNILTIVPYQVSFEDFFQDGRIVPIVPLGELAGEPGQLSLSDVFLLEEELAGEAHVYALQRGGYRDQNMDFDFSYLSLTPGFFDMMGWEVSRGRLINSRDVQENRPVMVLGEEMARILFPDEDPLGQVFSVGIIPQLEVIGILKTPDIDPNEYVDGVGMGREISRMAYIPFNTAMQRSLGLLPDRSSSTFQVRLSRIQVAPVEEGQTGYITRRIEEILKPVHGLGFRVRSPLTMAGQGESWQMIFTLGTLAGIALLVAALNILNLMMARVLRQTRSIGLNIALGARRRTIFSQYLGEALFLGLSGGILGVLLSFAVFGIIRSVLAIPFQAPTWTVAVSGIGIAILATLLFGLYPAYQAAKINPADTLRTD